MRGAFLPSEPPLVRRSRSALEHSNSREDAANQAVQIVSKFVVRRTIMVDTAAQNTAIARRFFDDVFNKGQLHAVDEIFAKDYVGFSSASLRTIKEFVKTH